MTHKKAERRRSRGGIQTETEKIVFFERGNDFLWSRFLCQSTFCFVVSGIAFIRAANNIFILFAPLFSK